ncbi:hypothetical protein KUF71_000914 [Frankliniella fusca]|uniref:Uncharacterized protein n=1 Tax=Frankliniella fusca TaxID=407009 RepID=A0AAE1HBI2_9NEOP|nr:hypothetical protein KUF71_000914 [Frankliniella fusca]
MPWSHKLAVRAKMRHAIVLILNKKLSPWLICLLLIVTGACVTLCKWWPTHVKVFVFFYTLVVLVLLSGYKDSQSIVLTFLGTTDGD